ncbi:MAG TPA: YkgJ family cysteine cluster protein [Thermoanaerobaculia bacterium]|nr:YkgJ family cysteine cluster protein [Thermoanaerobaculia bacterium]
MTIRSASPPKRLLYDCSKCPAYCCSYLRIVVEPSDIARLARHFNIERAEAEKRFTKIVMGERVLRHRKDTIYPSVCMFLDRETRKCTIYEARPDVCREYPEGRRCGYYDFLSWERDWQEDDEFIPLERSEFE